MVKLKLQPLADKIIVRRDEAADKTPGGIVLPDQAQEIPARGKVLAVGEGKLLDDGTRQEMPVEEGDTVLFGRYAGNKVEFEDEEFLILSTDDLLAVIV